MCEERGGDSLVHHPESPELYHHHHLVRVFFMRACLKAFGMARQSEGRVRIQTYNSGQSKDQNKEAVAITYTIDKTLFAHLEVELHNKITVLTKTPHRKQEDLYQNSPDMASLFLN